MKESNNGTLMLDKCLEKISKGKEISPGMARLCDYEMLYGKIPEDFIPRVLIYTGLSKKPTLGEKVSRIYTDD